MTVSNVQVAFTATADREYTLTGDKWPSAKQLAEALSDYIKKRTQSRRLYNALTFAQRDPLKPHPDI